MVEIGVIPSIETTDFKEIVEVVKGRTNQNFVKGHWRINIRPFEFDQNKIESLDHCWKIIEDCQVLLRGWGYPTINPSEMISHDDWIQSNAKHPLKGFEAWKFYQSGQFIQYFTCVEDFPAYHKVFPPYIGAKLGILATLYRITEIYKFVSRLAQKNVLDTGAKVCISLKGMEGRRLEESGKILAYTSEQDEIKIESSLSAIDLMTSLHEEALNKTLEIYSKFGFSNSKVILRAEQDRLLEKRLG